MVFCCPSCRCIVITVVVAVLLFFGTTIVIASIRSQMQKSLNELTTMVGGPEAWNKAAHELGLIAAATTPSSSSSYKRRIEYHAIYDALEEAMGRLLSTPAVAAADNNETPK